jgi:hypothetical protein
MGHPPDLVQATALLGAIAGGAIVEITAALFLGSDEYYAAHGSTPEGFVAGLFVDIFGVTLDAGNRVALGAVVRAGYSRISLAVLMLVHPAARGHMVDVAYQRYLGHAPNTIMRAWWVDAIGRGVPSDYLVAYLVATEEYVNLG